MERATISLTAPPPAFDRFEHPEVADGQSMQIVALDIDERRRRLRLDLG